MKRQIELNRFISILLLLQLIIGYGELRGDGLDSVNRLFPSKSYTETVDHESRQIWDIESDDRGVVYFATTRGLYSNCFGRWRETLTGRSSTDLVRSIHIDNSSQDTIWSGHTGAIGVYVYNRSGVIEFTELFTGEFGTVWNIEEVNNTIYFQTEYNIIIYDKESNSWSNIESDIRVNNIYLRDGRVWCTIRDGSVGYIDGTKVHIEAQSDLLNNREVRVTITLEDKEYYILLSGEVVVYDFENSTFSRVETPTEKSGLFSAIKLDDSRVVLGTIVDGAIITDSLHIVDADIKTTIDSDSGLDDNTVLSIHQDINGQLWFGQDYGISYVEINSPFRKIFSGATVYDVTTFNNRLYIATNKGLYRFDSEKSTFTLCPGTEGQVWNLHSTPEVLYIAHIKGVLSIDRESSVNYVDSTGGVDAIISSGGDNFIVRTLSGISLSYIDERGSRQTKEIVDEPYGRGYFSEKLSNRDYDIYIVGGDNRSALYIKVDRRSLDVVLIPFESSRLFFVDNQIVSLNDTTLNSIAVVADNIELEPIDKPPLNSIDSREIFDICSSKDMSRVVSYIDDKIIYYDLLQTGLYMEYSNLFGKFNGTLNKQNSGIKMMDNYILLYSGQSLYSYNLDYIGRYSGYTPIVESVISKNLESTIEYRYPATLSEDRVTLLSENVTINYAINSQLYDNVDFSYTLSSEGENFSDWTTDRKINFTNLSNGDYTFILKARVNGVVLDPLEYNFTIDGAWYQKGWGITLIVLSILGLIILTVAYREGVVADKRAKNLEEVHEKVLVEQQHKQALEFLSRLEQKNIFLAKIKESLSKMRNEKARELVREIDVESKKETNEFIYFNFFTSNQQEFINRISNKFPQLTQNDLRLITFIRLNMTSKEIADITHISVTSIDKARYRLRKKLDLHHDTSLTRFINELV